MKITCEPTGVLEVKDVVVDGTKIIGTPLFYGRGTEATALLIQVLGDNGKALSTYVLKINGRNGTCTLSNKAYPTKALMEQ